MCLDRMDEKITTPPNKPGYTDSIKEHEKGRLNPAYTILDKQFYPVEGVTYIWVYTEKKEVVLGIEQLNSENMKAIGDSTKNEKWVIDFLNGERQQQFNTIKLSLTKSQNPPLNIDEKAKRIQFKLGMGHPTLAVGFNERGETSNAKVYIAGEFYFSDNGWHINNQSGRFHKIQNNDSSIMLLMLEVSQKISACINKPIKIKICHEKENPHTIWMKSIKKESHLNLVERGHYVLMKLFKAIIDGGQQAELYKKLDHDFFSPDHVAKVLGKQPESLNLHNIIDYYKRTEIHSYLKEILPQSINCKIDLLFRNLIDELNNHLSESDQQTTVQTTRQMNT
jgi:hypothetical protein